ncbi:MAG TPA: glycosyltransferase [Acidimicrobiales bacterium]|nr:glycosyltransferase [Acidimicrobiales bacterium]
MRVVVDGLSIRGENSLSIVAEHLLEGWGDLAGNDEVHLVVRAGAVHEAPDSVIVHEVRFGRLPFLSRLRAQSFLLPRLCRSLAADVLLGLIPATTVTPLPCPRAVIVWDFRYRVLPEQFSRKARWLRRISYAIGFRQAKGAACISDRTRRDLLFFHPRLANLPVRVAHLGADHVDTWPVRPKDTAYAIAFGHFPNKNVDLTLLAWKELTEQTGHEEVLALRVVGVPDSDRARVEERIETLGLIGVATVQPWLPKESFQEEFASSSLVVFPSDFEGFGLPAVEALRLGIPLVITPEPALLEVTAGHATVVDGQGPSALARAVAAARRTTPEAITAAREHAAPFTWTHFAADVRTTLSEVMERVPRLRPAWARTRVRLAGTVAAATIALSGAGVAAYALTVPVHSAPASHGVVTTTTGASAPAAGTKAHAGPASTHGAASTGTPEHSPTAGAPGAPSSGSGSSGGTTGSGGSPSPTLTVPTLPTVPTVTMPTVTPPTVPATVPTVTIPGSVCTTTTTLGKTVVSVPCTVPAP